MTLTHLNEKFLQSPPLPANPFGTALVKTIREKLLTPNVEPIYASSELFDWLLTMIDSAPTATTFGSRFFRVYKDEDFIDIIELKPNQDLNSGANNPAKLN